MKLLTSILKAVFYAEFKTQKTAIFGDIHSNIEAFDAVIADMEKNGVTQFICTGDIVGYGADPSACIQRIQALSAIAAKGNHDEYCAGGLIQSNITPLAIEAILWTKKKLTASESSWLRNLPMTQHTRDLSIVHSTFEPAQNWPYILTKQNATPCLRLQPSPLAFYGHTHRPTAFIQNKEGQVIQKPLKKIRIKKGNRYLINPGSVGQPRDGDPRAAYVIYNPSKKTMVLRRVIYDVQTTAEKILKAGLPARNAERLAMGK